MSARMFARRVRELKDRTNDLKAEVIDLLETSPSQTALQGVIDNLNRASSSL